MMEANQLAEHATGASTAGITVANAPVSYGAFEITVGVDPHVPDPVGLLDAVSGAGYVGVDLGPLGYLGDAQTLRGRLEDHGLGLAGGYLELPFSEPERFADALGELHALLDVFDAVATAEPRPRPTLADAGSPERSRHPGRAATERSLGLDDAGWARLADSLEQAVQICRARGYDPTFHHHTATFVEAKWEIDRLLEVSDVGLCLDTGHLLVGHGDPVAAVAEWAGRINHVHLKDARLATIEDIVAESGSVQEIWRRRAFCALGDGDIDIDAILRGLAKIEYAGWMVVEQDVLPDPARPDQPSLDQRRNRQYLRARGL